MADISITAASVITGSSDNIGHGFAAASITAGQVLYRNSAGKYDLADNDNATAAVRVPVGVALHAAATNQPIAFQRSGSITIGGTLTAGTAYYLSSTAGGICPFADLATGDDVVQLGLATSTTVLNLDIQVTGVTL